MKDTIIAIIVGLITSFVYDSLKTLLKRKPASNDSHEYTRKYFRDVKLEFYISFPAGVLLAFTSIKCPEPMNIGAQALSFFMFFISLMAFTCLAEMVNNLTNDHSGKNSK